MGQSLNKIHKTYYSQNSYNNKFGVPISLFNIEKQDRYGIFEVGMDKKGEINYLSKIRLYNLPTTGIAIFNLHSKNWKEIISPKYLELDLIKFPKDLKS